MNRLHKFVSVAALVAMPMLSVGVGQAAADPLPVPTFTVTPNPTVGGTTVTFSGTGCFARQTDPPGSLPVVTISEVEEPETSAGMQAHAIPHAVPMADDGDPTTTPDPVTGRWSIRVPVPGYVTGNFTFAAVCDGYDWSISYNPLTLQVKFNAKSKALLVLLDFIGSTRPTLQTGKSYALLGEGFKPGEKVQLVLHSDPIVLDTAIADPDYGAVVGTFILPAATSAGAHTLSLHGVTSGKTVTQNIVVAGAPVTTVVTTVTTTASPTPVASTTAVSTSSSTSTPTPTSASTSVVTLAATGTPAKSMASLGALLVLLGAGTLVLTRRLGRRPYRQH